MSELPGVGIELSQTLVWTAKKHIKRKNVSCTQCKSTFYEESHLKQHMKTHVSGKTLSKCIQCDLGTFQESYLKKHLMTHIQEKSFKCSQCSFATSTKENLLVCIWLHSGEKPFKCDLSSAYSSLIKTHLKTVHIKEKPFKLHLLRQAI